MSNHHVIRTTILENGTDSTIKYGSGSTALLTSDIDAFVVECNVAETSHRVVTIMADHVVIACNRHRQTAFIATEIAG